MNNKWLIGIIVVLLALLVWDRIGTSEKIDPAVPTEATSAITATKDKPDSIADISTGKPDRRTWVIFKTEQPANEHIGFGDAFRIIKTGPTYKLLPLTLLRKRWHKTSGFVVNLEESPAGLLCGNVNLTPHSEDPTSHLLVIKPEGPDELQVDYEVFDDTKTVIEQCVEVSGTHKGRAHAET